MHVECLRSLGRARVRWCGFAMTVAEMRPAPAPFRYRFLARAETCAPERGLAKQKPIRRVLGLYDFDCNCAVDFRPKPCGAASKDIVQRTRETMRVGSRSHKAREMCKPLHSPYDVTALRSQTRDARVALLHAAARAIDARWRRVGTVSSRHRRDPVSSAQAKQ